MKWLIALWVVMLNSTAIAHQLSTAYLNAQFSDQAVLDGSLQLRLLDLARTLNLDSNNDDALNWGEVSQQQRLITEFIAQHLKITRGDRPCSVFLPPQWKADEHFNEGYLVLPLEAQCALRGELNIQYSAFFNEDSNHKLIVLVHTATSEHTGIISSDEQKLSFNLENSGRLASAKSFIGQGMVHIWLGLDHILFLFSLLITCVISRQNGRWQANPNRRIILIDAAWVVSAFTLAHSITLSLTALNLVHLPSRWVEVVIAATVAFAALNNIFSFVKKIRLLTLVFGLVHGMGFAGVLSELGLPADNQLLSILAFNLGVEIGQLVIVLCLLPLLLYWRSCTWYRQYGVWGISSLISVLAMFWITQRL